MLTIGAWCNNARVSPGEDGAEAWQVIGDPTEGALLVAALKAGIEADDREHRVLHEIPFDSERKAMSVVVRGPGGRPSMYTKGAPEVVLARCVAERRGGEVVPLTDDRRQEIMGTNAEMAARALRVLALAYREVPDGDHAQDRGGRADLRRAGRDDRPAARRGQGGGRHGAARRGSARS